jgi:hypothetical protein
VLPDFQLRAIGVPLSAYLATPEYPDWFAALDALRTRMEAAMPFDVAIVGAGAWSISLVAHAKKLGAWAIHLGGATQILFGVRGRRWETNKRVAAFYNEAWTRPSESETPANVQAVEEGCYW